MPVRTMTELESEGRVISVSHGKSSVTTVAARRTASTTVRGLPRTGLGSRSSLVAYQAVSSPTGRDVRVGGGEGG